jgi:phthiocerol/phenolphthiocerol synthesis type-I polyketide synthase D
MGQKTSDVENWIVTYVAKLLEVAQESLDVDEALVNLGLSSRQALMLTAGLEEFLDKPVDPALVWEFPTIRQLARHLSEGE